MLDSTQKELDTSRFFIDLVTFKLPLIKAIFVATELNIADCIGNKEYDIKELSQIIGTCEDNLYRLLRVLSSFGIFSEVKDRCFVNTTNSNMLCKNINESVRDLVLWDAGELTWKSLEGLENCVRTGKTAFDQVFGMPFFDYLKANPNHKMKLYNALSAFKQIFIPQILNNYDFSRFGSILDIGGGDGDLILKIQSDYPHLKCMLFEQNESLPTLTTTNKQDIEIVSGSFFSDPLPTADCYIMKLILHDWNDDKCHQILNNCSKSLDCGGKLLIVESVLVEGSDHELFSKLLDLEMMILTGGKQRTPKEFRDLLDASGFNLSKVIQTDTPLFIIEATKL
jgi:hypothetical protein